MNLNATDRMTTDLLGVKRVSFEFDDGIGPTWTQLREAIRTQLPPAPAGTKWSLCGGFIGGFAGKGRAELDMKLDLA